jgi:hypothetical protein
LKRASSFARVSLACALPALAGCIYAHTTRPLTTDLHGAPVVDEEASGDVKRFQYYVRVAWDSNAIGEIAKEHGFEEVYYADLETLRILGIWTQRWVHVYGRKAASDAD